MNGIYLNLNVNSEKLVENQVKSRRIIVKKSRVFLIQCLYLKKKHCIRKTRRCSVMLGFVFIVGMMEIVELHKSETVRLLY